MAIKGKRFGNDRTKLEEAIPLGTPLLLFVDPSSGCNYSCPFCACGKANRHNWSKAKSSSIGQMPYELYRKVIDDCSIFPSRIKTLRLYKEGEPLLNRRLPDMIHYAKKSDIFERIDFTTNASLLTGDLGLAISDAGLDRINISVSGLSDEDCISNSGQPNIKFKTIYDNIRTFYKNRGGTYVYVKIVDIALGNSTEKEFDEIFGEISDEYNIEYVTPVWPEHNAGAVKSDFNNTIHGTEFNSHQICSYIFYSICVNSDGSVSSCLMDWNHKNIVGDVHNSSIVDIWNSEQMNEMRRNHLRLNRALYQTCGNCGELKYAQRDNIDPYREMLLRRLAYGN